MSPWPPTRRIGIDRDRSFLKISLAEIGSGDIDTRKQPADRSFACAFCKMVES
ncbi:MAG: hypothetical protein ISN28_01655 [Ectothiorhodospiraceae bacterium AqS1]|nr:hypothetical protein [Ectothiorhodospiraceae bacterium AqS1]